MSWRVRRRGVVVVVCWCPCKYSWAEAAIAPVVRYVLGIAETVPLYIATCMQLFIARSLPLSCIVSSASCNLPPKKVNTSQNNSKQIKTSQNKSKQINNTQNKPLTVSHDSASRLQAPDRCIHQLRTVRFARFGSHGSK